MVARRLPDPAIVTLRPTAWWASFVQAQWTDEHRKTPRYTLEVQPSKRTDGAYEWAIRDRGKLIKRGDRVERSGQAARKRGEDMLDQIIHGLDR